MIVISRSRFVLVSGLLFLAARAVVSAQEPSLEDLLPGLRERAVIMEIAARIVEQNQEIVWNSEDSRVTIPGRPVGLKLVGANVIVAVQFTPYFRAEGLNFLVAQGQVWIEVPNKGISYQATTKTIPLEFGEQIYFFPLGSSADSRDDARIEIQLVLHPYVQEDLPANPGDQENAVP
jgi:hypothetical protein